MKESFEILSLVENLEIQVEVNRWKFYLFHVNTHFYETYDAGLSILYRQFNVHTVHY
jgi:hypothetical protein